MLEDSEEDRCFAARGFPEGGDADFIVGLGVDDGNGHSVKQPQCVTALLAVLETVIFECAGRAVEHAFGIGKAEPVITNVGLAFEVRPRESHGRL